MSNEADIQHRPTEIPRPARERDPYTELLLGLHREIQQQGVRFSEHERALARLAAELRESLEASEKRLLAAHDAAEQRQGTRIQEVSSARSTLARAVDEARARYEGSERRLVALEEDLRHERARLSELRAESEGLQEKLMRSSLAAGGARTSARRARWMAGVALVVAIVGLGLELWPKFREVL